MTSTRVLMCLALSLALSGCDDVMSIVDAAADKGGTDVPEEARAPLDEDTQDALRRRIAGQNFN